MGVRAVAFGLLFLGEMLFGGDTLFFSDAWGEESYTWTQVYRQIAQDFPSVREITTTELHQRLQREDVVIIDVRTTEEFQVSHLKSAKHYTALAEIIKDYRADQEVVVYCSVGYRSAKIVQALQNHGFENVYNLRGSIFMWANQAYPVYQAHKEVFKVHPYNSVWGLLLKGQYHAYTP